MIISKHSLTFNTLFLLTFLNICVSDVHAEETADVPEIVATEVVSTPKIKFSKITEAEKKAEIIALDQTASDEVNELVTLSEKLVKALTTRNQTLFYECLDKEEIVNTALAGAIQKLDDLKAERDNIIRGIVALPEILISKIGLRGHAKYLRLVKRDDGYRGLIRLRFNTGEITYLELIIQKDSNGESKVVDYLDVMLGRNYTTIVSQMLITAEKNTSSVNKIVYISKKPLSFQQRYAKTIRHYQKNEFKLALDSFQHLPAKFQVTRDMLLLRVQIAKAFNQNAYREALTLLDNKYSTESDLALLLSDHYFFTKQYSSAFKSIDTFSEYIGGDIALDNLRVKLLINQKKIKEAISIGATAIRDDNSYEDIHWSMLRAYLQTYQYQHVGETLDVLQDKFNVKFDIENFYKDPFYQEYGFSKQFKQWKEKRLAKSEVIEKEN